MAPPPGARLALLAVLLWAVALRPAAGKRTKLPALLPAVVQALKPTGLRISVQGEEGMDLVTVNANINKPIEPKETGTISQTLHHAQDGFWTLETPSQELKHEDAVFYWIFASGKHGQRRVTGHHIISEFVDPSCKPSITTVNGQPACKGALVFEDNFDTLNTSVWRQNVRFFPDMFNAFVLDDENTFTTDGVLHLKATAITNEVQLSEPMKLEGCNAELGSEDCEREPFAWKINPPTRCGWISTISSFRFGRFEVRAKAAVGDWMFSRLSLHPRSLDYGSEIFESGELIMAQIRGNPDLRTKGGDNVGANQNYVRTAVSSCSIIDFDQLDKKLPNGLYSNTFHTFAMTWTPQEISFELDGEVYKRVVPPIPDGFAGIDRYKDCVTNWERGSFMAPFDKEFSIHMTNNVGGWWAFEDGWTSGNHKKPWNSGNPRFLLQFWRARDEWLPTWKEDFEIDYVKVWAL